MRLNGMPIKGEWFDKQLAKFEQVRNDMPKLTEQHVTSRTAFMAKTDSALIVKVSRKVKIMINPDNTWEFV